MMESTSGKRLKKGHWLGLVMESTNGNCRMEFPISSTNESASNVVNAVLIEDEIVVIQLLDM